VLRHNRLIRKLKKAYSYQITQIPEEQRGFTVLVPVLPGGVSYGATIEEATENAREAVELDLENLAAHHEPIPARNKSVCIFTATVCVRPSYV